MLATFTKKQYDKSVSIGDSDNIVRIQKNRRNTVDGLRFLWYYSNHL